MDRTAFYSGYAFDWLEKSESKSEAVNAIVVSCQPLPFTAFKAGNAIKRTRAAGVAAVANSAVEAQHSEDLRARKRPCFRESGTIDPTRSSGLLSLPESILCRIAALLTIGQFVTLLRINKEAMSSFDYLPLGKHLIRDMSVARYGYQILAAVPKVTLVRQEWQWDLALSFARKVTHVVVAKQTVLVEAWQNLIQRLPKRGDSLPMLLRFYARPIDAQLAAIKNNDETSIFREMLRVSLEDQYAYLNTFPISNDFDLVRITKTFVRSGKIFRQPTQALAPILASKIAVESGFANISTILAEKFSLPVCEQRTHLDTLVADNIMQFGLSLERGCERWRPGDVAFLHRAEASLRNRMASYLYRNQPLCELENVGTEYIGRFRLELRNVFLSAGIDVNTLSSSRSIDGMEAVIFQLVEQIAAVSDTLEWWTLCEHVYELAWQTWPFFMYQLAVHAPFRCADFNCRRDAHDYFSHWLADIEERADRTTQWNMIALGKAALIELWRPDFAAIDPLDGDWEALGFAREGLFALRQAELERAFATLPPEHWQPILEAWLGPNDTVGGIAEEQRFQKHLKTFFVDTHACLVLPSSRLNEKLLALLDAGDLLIISGAITFSWDDLCSRMGWDPTHVRARLLDGVYRLISKGDLMLEDALTLAKIADAAAYTQLGKRLWLDRILPDLRAGKEWHASVSKYTCLFKSFLFDHARIYAAGIKAPH